MNRDYLAKTIVLIDDEAEALALLKSILACEGYQNIVTFTNPLEARQYFENHAVSAVVLDLRMPMLSGKDLLAHLAERRPKIPVIVVTAENQVEIAIDCMRLGAIDYLVKPVMINRFLSAIGNALEINALDGQINTAAASGQKVDNPVPSIVTGDRQMLAQISYLAIVARSSQPILITGETGVGKELFARAAHDLSGREGQFVCVNVAGLDDLMFSDSLFGHKKGAYTGAMQDRDGLVRKAAKGTLFLDEIGDLNEMSQIKLLRLIQENEYYPLGADIQVSSQARILLATNRDLKELVLKGEFRKDLYYRLCTHRIFIPPLRERPGDIPLLFEHFLNEAAAGERHRFSYRQDLLDLLGAYLFPGNARELQSMVLDIVARSRDGRLSTAACREIMERGIDAGGKSLPDSHGRGETEGHGISFAHFPTLSQAEEFLIRKALEIAGNNQGRAAKLLGISRQALNNRLRRNGHPPSSHVEN